MRIVSAKSLEWDSLTNVISQHTNAANISLLEGYQVPLIYRSVQIRANALSSLPFGLFQVSNGDQLDDANETYQFFQNLLKPLLYQIESCLCVYGAAYLLLERNALGQKPVPRALAPQTITPQYDASGNLTHFNRVFSKGLVRIELEDIVYFWLPSLEYENAPGISPLMSVLGQASTLKNLSEFSQAYFSNGALMPMVFFLEDSTTGSISTAVSGKEVETFLTRIRRLMTGIKNAWKVEAMRGKVHSERIGSTPSEVAAPELSKLQREDICTAFGIPESLIFSNSATYGSALQDIYNLYDLVILHTATVIVAPKLNEWFSNYDLRLEFQPQKLECYQEYYKQQSSTLTSLVKEGILTVDEARAVLDYPPMTEQQKLQNPEETLQKEITKSWSQYP